MSYDPENLEDLKQALERVGYTLDDTTLLEDFRDIMDELGLADLEDLEDLL